MASILSSSRIACYRSSGSLPTMRPMSRRPISSTSAHYQMAGIERKLPPTLPDSIRPGPSHHAGVEVKVSPVGEASKCSTQAMQASGRHERAAHVAQAAGVASPTAKRV